MEKQTLVILYLFFLLYFCFEFIFTEARTGYKIPVRGQTDMKKNYNIYDFLEMYYPDSNIPAYLYRDQIPVYCVPTQAGLTFPPKKYLDILLNKEARISYCSTAYGIYFGCIRLDPGTDTADRRLVFGPIGNIPFTDADLHSIYSDYLISAENRESFTAFLRQIPEISLASFLARLTFINYCLHGEKYAVTDFLPYEDRALSDASALIEENYNMKENLYHNRSYELEAQTLNLIRAGNPQGFLALKTNDSRFHTGVTGPTALRQIKNNIVITTTLSTRAAIEGGLDYDTAYQLSDKFIQEAEVLQNADNLYALLSKIAYTFAQKVYEAKTPVASSDRIQKAIRFIQQNTNQHITACDVADYVGFSRAYFSAYFKKELGFSLSAFILRCKLEEGRRLLQYTDKPLSTISNYLCFSSQSHFQTAFKKQFGITPMEYRRGK